MKVTLKLISTDLESSKSQVLADTAALFDGRRLLYQEKDTKAKHQIIWGDDAVTIRREDEITSVTTLEKKGNGRTSIISEYGTMELDAVCEMILRTDTMWTVVYRIESQGETTLHQRLDWHITQFE